MCLPLKALTQRCIKKPGNLYDGTFSEKIVTAVKYNCKKVPL